MQNKAMQLLKVKKIAPYTADGDWETIKGYVQQHFNGTAVGAFVVMYHGVCMGSFANGEFIMPKWLSLEPEYVRSIRVFDADRECYIWKNSSHGAASFHIRFIHDEIMDKAESELQYIVEARQLLWGTSLEICPNDEKWVVLKEKRGIKLLIHQSLLPANADINISNRLWLITRNYIDYTPLGQAGYVDCRFVGIEDERGKRG